MRLSDVMLAFPALLLALLFSAVFRPSAETAMAAIGIALVPVFARVVRGAGLQVLQQDYVTIVRTYGRPLCCCVACPSSRPASRCGRAASISWSSRR